MWWRWRVARRADLRSLHGDHGWGRRSLRSLTAAHSPERPMRGRSVRIGGPPPYCLCRDAPPAATLVPSWASPTRSQAQMSSSGHDPRSGGRYAADHSLTEGRTTRSALEFAREPPHGCSAGLRASSGGCGLVEHLARYHRAMGGRRGWACVGMATDRAAKATGSRVVLRGRRARCRCGRQAGGAPCRPASAHMLSAGRWRASAEAGVG